MPTDPTRRRRSTMRGALRLALAAILAIAMMGSACTSKDGDKGGTDYGGSLASIGCEKGKERWVTHQVTMAKLPTGEDAPYTIEVSARTLNADKPLSAHIGPEPHAGRPLWHTKMCYTSGVQVEITFEVTGSAVDTFGCWLSDGPTNRSEDHGLAAATCHIITEN